MADLERLYTVPLKKAYDTGSRTFRAKRAVKILREFVQRHMKADSENVRISNSLNSFVYSRGIKKPPRRVKIRAVKDSEGKVLATLATEAKPKKEEKPDTKKEEKKAETKPEEKAAKKEKKADEKKKEPVKKEKAPAKKTVPKKESKPAEKPKEKPKEEKKVE